MSLLLSFMHYVCYIMSVPLCTEESELSQTVWLILFLCTLAVESLVMLACQGHRSWPYQDFFTTDTRSLLFICPYGHVFFLMTDRAADGQKIFFFSPPAPVVSPPQPAPQEHRANSIFNLLINNGVNKIPNRCSVSLFVWHGPDLPQSRSWSELWGGHHEVNHGQMPT